MKREQKDYLVYVNWIVLRHQRLALLSVSNDLTELKDSAKHKEDQFNISTDPSVASLIPQQNLNWVDYDLKTRS